MSASPGMLLTDLYQLTMLQAYFDGGMDEEAVFEFFARDLPPGRGYLVAAGLTQVLDYLHQARFDADEIQWLRQDGRFTEPFLDWLRAFRFRGEVHAMAEGTVFFPEEPILRVTAPIRQAQLVETRIINLLQYQTLVATKAARCVTVAPGKLLVDFGLRRAHGAEAGMLAARACYLAGFAGSSNVAAARAFAMPAFGTMAHSFVQAHDDELQAFEQFARAQPGNVVLLLDTYDTEAAAARLGELAPRLRLQGLAIDGVRLDSGDLAQHALRVREILDRNGLAEVTIFASGNLDEFELQRLLAAGAPIDGFGVGSKLDTSADAPYLDCAYKLMEYAGLPRRKHSEAKSTWPGRKQVFRQYDGQGLMVADTVALAHEAGEGEALLQPVMRDGEPLPGLADLEGAREHMAAQLQRLPPALQDLRCEAVYPVHISPGMGALARETDAFIARHAAACNPWRAAPSDDNPRG